MGKQWVSFSNNNFRRNNANMKSLNSNDQMLSSHINRYLHLMQTKYTKQTISGCKPFSKSKNALTYLSTHNIRIRMAKWLEFNKNSQKKST